MTSWEIVDVACNIKHSKFIRQQLYVKGKLHNPSILHIAFVPSLSNFHLHGSALYFKNLYLSIGTKQYTATRSRNLNSTKRVLFLDIYEIIDFRFQVTLSKNRALQNIISCEHFPAQQSWLAYSRNTLKLKSTGNADTPPILKFVR